MSIIGAKMEQNDRIGLNAPLFFRLSALSGLELKYDLHRLQSFEKFLKLIVT